MSSKLKTSVLAFGLMGVLGSGLAFAQTAPATTAPATDAAPAPAADVQIPEILQGSGFADVETKPGRRGGLFVEGSLAETGKDFDAMVNAEGKLVGMRTAEGSALPQAVVDALLPEAARANPILSEIAQLNAIGSRDGAVMVGGQDASGDDVRIGFDAEGELVHFDRGEHGKRGKGMGMGDREGHGPRGERGDHGDRGGKGRGGDHGDHDRMGPRDGDGPRGDGPREGAAPPVDEAALRSAIEGAGYTELGEIARADRGLAVEALNPQGEAVLVIVTPSGEVVRETAR